MLKFGAIILLLASIAVPSLLSATQGQQDAEARINAYKHEDGRIEFAMQVRDGTSWGERILPRGRFFPASAPVGRWLSSTAVEISIPAGLYTPIVTHGQMGDVHYGSTIDLGEGHIELDDPGLLTSTVRVEPSSIGNEKGRTFRARLSFSCSSAYWYRVNEGGDIVRHDSSPSYSVFEAGVDFEFDAPPGVAIEGATASAYLRNEGPAIEDIGFGFVDVNYRYLAHAQSSGEPAVLFRARSEDGSQLDWWRTSLNIDRAFMYTLRQYAQYYDSLTVGVIGVVGRDRNQHEAFQATFDYSDIFNTPIQTNLERCGEY